MNAIQKLFRRKSNKILSVYFTAGYPNLEDTGTIIQSLARHGADMIEIGMPYSDPVADGPVIEKSSQKALENGMTIKELFSQLDALNIGNKSEVPLILMGYLNPVLQYGFEKFCKDAAAAGISGMIIPDLPMREFQNDFSEIVKKYALEFIFLITPETTETRIREIDDLSKGFIYAVSSSSITGRDTDNEKKEIYLERIQKMKLKNPVLVGFGIKDKRTFEQACNYTNGAISGTAYIRLLEENADINEISATFLRSFD